MQHRCLQCPRGCGADRSSGEYGYCGVPWGFRVVRASLHAWEEPSISGTRGSGTIFFSGCNLRCVFCQNRVISHETLGRELDADALIGVMLRLRDAGAHNINLVTPTPYAYQLAEVLRRVKPTLGVPVVYNCGGYESVETLRRLEGLVDVYLPDFKYFGTDCASRYSDAADYHAVATDALAEMLRQTGEPRFDGDGMLLRGTIVRHLVLPANRKDSIALLNDLAERFGTRSFLLSLMSQYTPTFAKDCAYSELHRRVTTFEYDAVLKEAQALGFEGYFQARDSATAEYTPDFSDGGYLPIS